MAKQTTSFFDQAQEATIVVVKTGVGVLGAEMAYNLVNIKKDETERMKAPLMFGIMTIAGIAATAYTAEAAPSFADVANGFGAGSFAGLVKTALPEDTRKSVGLNGLGATAAGSTDRADTADAAYWESAYNRYAGNGVNGARENHAEPDTDGTPDL